MKLLFALLALAMSSFAVSQQNVPSRSPANGCETSSTAPAGGNRDARRLQKANELLDLAVAALGGDADSLSRNSVPSTVEAKAEFVAERLIRLCQDVACTTNGDSHAEN